MSETGDSTKTEYPRPSLTADVIALGLGEGGRLSVLLIKRGRDPYKDRWAIPGGFCEPTESVEQAGARELKEETELSGLELEQLGVYSAPGRDPRGWVVSVVFIGLVPSHRFGEARGSDDASDAKWWPIARRPGETPPFELEREGDKTGPLAFDHDQMLTAALKRIHKEADRFALGLLPETFTETELRSAFEAVLGEPLHAEVLIRVLTERKLIKEAGEGGEGERRFTRAQRRSDSGEAGCDSGSSEAGNSSGASEAGSDSGSSEEGSDSGSSEEGSSSGSGEEGSSSGSSEEGSSSGSSEASSSSGSSEASSGSGSSEADNSSGSGEADSRSGAS